MSATPVENTVDEAVEKTLGQQWSVGYWRRTEIGQDGEPVDYETGHTRWRCEAEQLVFAFLADEPKPYVWIASLTTPPNGIWEGGFPQ